MKLIKLSAFQGRLISEAIEWPDWPPEVTILTSQWIGSHYTLGKDLDLSAPVQTYGVFRATNKYGLTANKSSFQFYELIGIR